MRRFRPTSALVLAAAFAAALALPASSAEVSREQGNVVLTVPETWRFSDPGPEWAKAGIVMRAFRRLDKLKRGGEPTGQGGEVVVSTLDAPKDKTLDEIANDPQTRLFLMSRFGEDAAKWPPVKVDEDKLAPEETTRGDAVPVRILRVVGAANNLDGTPNPKSRGVLVLAIAKKKLIRIRMYAWPSEWDDEGLKDDLDFIEMSLALVETKEEKGPKPPGPSPDAAAPTDADLEGDAAKEMELGNAVKKWKMTKPKGLATKEIDHEAIPARSVYLEDSAAQGTYQVILDVFGMNDTNAQGQRYGDVDIKAWTSTQLWPWFMSTHPEGDIQTFDWPRRTKDRTMVTLPDLSKPAGTIAKDKRPIEADFAALEKLGVVEKLKKPRVGPKGEPNEGYRAAVLGNRPQIGPELIVRIAWKSSTHAYELTVTLTKDLASADNPRTQQILAALESMQLLEK